MIEIGAVVYGYKYYFILQRKNKKAIQWQGLGAGLATQYVGRTPFPFTLAEKLYKYDMI